MHQMERYEHSSMLKKRRLEVQCEETVLKLSTTGQEDNVAESESVSTTCGQIEVSAVATSCEQSCSIMTDMTVKNINDLERECDRLREENFKMKKELKSVEIPGSILNDNKKVCYFTGLPSIRTVRAIFEYVSPHVPNSRSLLPPF